MKDNMTPRWMTFTLWAAGLYNLIWGAVVSLFPNETFAWLGMQPLNYPQIWQCVGMIVGVYGIGYICAAGRPDRHWPVILVGFLGKLFGPIGFLWSATHGELPWRFGLLNIGNDLIWLIPFAFILRFAYRSNGK
jgi:small multidrug resistance pump